MNRWRRWALAALLSLCCLLSACTWPVWPEDSPSSGQTTAAQPVSVPDGAAPPAAVQIPPYTGDLWTELQGNQPGFTAAQYTTDSYEYYSPLDKLGRCGYTMACIGRDLMPTEKRGEIGMIRPSGWHTVRYDFLKDKYLYNRCHLIAYQLAGENDNVCNLITGTRYFNAEGMLSFEEQVGDYVRRTGYHVLYRVTPRFEGDNLVASGVEMEARSIEDEGKGVCFHVFVYNVQPGVKIDYKTGESSSVQKMKYVLNVNNYKFHTPDC